MTLFELWILAIGLAMDCLTVSIASGIMLRRIYWRTILLAFLGGKMIYESFKDEEHHAFNPHSLKVILTLSVATSIDALAVGISFSCIGYRTLQSILMPICIIGFTSLVISIGGFLTGIFAGKRFHFPVERVGGVLLIAIGLKILYTHLCG